MTKTLAVRSTAPLPPNVTGDLFDQLPIKLEGFVLSHRRAVAVGRPTLEQWLDAMTFAEGVTENAPYWWGDLMRYSEARSAEWGEKLTQALAVTGWAKQTLANYSSVCRRVDLAERAMSPSMSHSQVVAPLPPEDQRKWLAQASTENLSVASLKVAIRQARRQKVVTGRATLKGKHRVIYADPPWPYRDSQKGSAASDHYETMKLKDIHALPIAAVAEPDAVLFLWVPAPLLPDGLATVAAWGFEYKSNIVWDKEAHNVGHYVSVQHEHVLIATRGSCTPDRVTPMIPSVVRAARGEHSEKPAIVRAHIERLYDGPYLELFGRARVDGWTVYGNDARLFKEEHR